MRIVIIEDEQLMAQDLAETILRVEPSFQIVKVLESVKSAIAYFQENPTIDLIFSDIQLGDGLSFEVFKEVKITTPVIFCTAYDVYGLTAFKANGIDYILKPFSQEVIAESIEKYKQLKRSLSNPQVDFELIAGLFERKQQQEISILVYVKDKIVPIKLSEIACFYIENDLSYLATFNGKSHAINKSLDELEKISGSNFYRANRKWLIHRNAIKEASHYFHRKLLIHLSVPITIDESITVSKVKATSFLTWLSGS